MIRAALAIGAVAVAGTAAAVENAAEARAYVERVFAGDDCRMRLAAFETRMLEDGMAPRPEDIGTPEVGQARIFRQRRIMAALAALSETGGLRADADDPRFATLHIGPCG